MTLTGRVCRAESRLRPSRAAVTPAVTVRHGDGEVTVHGRHRGTPGPVQPEDGAAGVLRLGRATVTLPGQQPLSETRPPRRDRDRRAISKLGTTYSTSSSENRHLLSLLTLLRIYL